MCQFQPGADWAAWLPETCQVGWLVGRPGGPPVKCCSRRECHGGRGLGPLPYRERGFSLDKLFAGAPVFLVTPRIMWPVCLISRGSPPLVSVEQTVQTERGIQDPYCTNNGKPLLQSETENSARCSNYMLSVKKADINIELYIHFDAFYHDAPAFCRLVKRFLQNSKTKCAINRVTPK